MLQGWSPIVCMVRGRIPGLDMYFADPAQHIIAPYKDLDHDLSVDGVSARRMQYTNPGDKCDALPYLILCFRTDHCRLCSRR